MKKLKKMRFIALLLTLLLTVMMAVPTMSMAAAQPTVNLGTTVSSFAVLAHETITNTGATTISGDAGENVGLYPGTDFPGKELVNVSTSTAIHLTDAVAFTAQGELLTAYNDAAGRGPVTTIPTELGGTTLTPGVYDSANGTFKITGTLTLDGKNDPDPVFVFKTASTLDTAAGSLDRPASIVKLENGARYCRTFWQVGSSATLGTYSYFVGHIFASKSITATTGATVNGQLLALNGAVTLDHNTIINGFCAAPPAPPAPPTPPRDSNSSGGGGSPQIYPPLINVIKTPEPLALTSGQGLVTFTYKVTNPGMLALSNVSVTDDKVSPVNYVSGDVNADNLLQPNETWIYTGKMNLNATTTNTATAKGSANGMTATDIAFATVVVTPPPQIYPPLINVIKTPEPLALTSGQGLVTYTYKITNPGMVALSNVSVTDDKVSPVNYVSGDVNADNLLQPNETWIYTSKMNLNATTTNTATAKGSANGTTAIDITFATVVVTPSVVVTPTVPGGKVVTRTVTGGQLPKTSTPLYELLLIGAVLTLVGAVGWRSRKRYVK